MKDPLSLYKYGFSPNGITLGIIGGGQLGKMIGIEAKRNVYESSVSRS